MIKQCLIELAEARTILKYTDDKDAVLKKLQSIEDLLKSMDNSVIEDVTTEAVLWGSLTGDIEKKNVIIKNAVSSPSGISLGTVDYLGNELLLIKKGCRVANPRGSLSARCLKVREVLILNGLIDENNTITNNIVCNGLADSTILSVLYGYPKSITSCALMLDLGR